MNVQEFDTSLTDLETRVDRLRALYENWFRGYEKAEPAVARKEVERRVYALRKELPRNTALRFRYHQLYQRYTTLSSYWQRTARQIEEGTYRLQLQRMRRRNDEVARTMAPRAPSDKDSVQTPSYELDADAAVDLKSLLDEASRDRLGDALEGVPPASSPSVPAPGPRAVGRFARPSMTRSEPPAGPSLTLEERDAHRSLPRRAALPDDERKSGYPTLPPSARIPAANTGAIPGLPAPKLPSFSVQPGPPRTSHASPSKPPPAGSPAPKLQATGALPGPKLPGLAGGASIPPGVRPSLVPPRITGLPPLPGASLPPARASGSQPTGTLEPPPARPSQASGAEPSARPRAEARSAPSSGTGSKATRHSNCASSLMRGISQGPEIAMAALPALKVPVLSHWLRISVSGLAMPSSMNCFQRFSARAAPSVLMLS